RRQPEARGQGLMAGLPLRRHSISRIFLFPRCAQASIGVALWQVLMLISQSCPERLSRQHGKEFRDGGKNNLGRRGAAALFFVASEGGGDASTANHTRATGGGVFRGCPAEPAGP